MNQTEVFYRQVLRIRRVEEEVARVYPTDKIKSPVHLSIGQEGVSVGICAALRKTDVVCPTYRGHALYLAKGGDLNAMIAELYRWILTDGQAFVGDAGYVPLSADRLTEAQGLIGE